MKANGRDNSDTQLSADKIWETGWTYIKHVVDTAREPFLILDENLVVSAANEAFYRVFQVTEVDTEKQLIYKLGNGQWDIPPLKRLLEDILPKNTFFKDFEVDHVFPTIGHKIMLLNARRIFIEDPANVFPKLIILAMEDVTRQRLIEERLAEYSKELEAKVLERTIELERRIEQLEILNKVMAGREIKMVELKKEIGALKDKSD